MYSEVVERVGEAGDEVVLGRLADLEVRRRGVEAETALAMG